MPYKCDCCGELVPCRRIPKAFYSWNIPVEFYYRCIKCDKAIRLLRFESEREAEECKIKEQQAWIKQRDKILKDNKQ